MKMEIHFIDVRFKILIFYVLAAGTFNGNQLITAGESIFHSVMCDLTDIFLSLS